MTHREERGAGLEAQSIIGFDAYSKDNQFVGRVMGLLPVAEEDAQAFEDVHTDTVGADGRVHGPRHLLISAIGTPLQADIVVTLQDLVVDLPGRRVSLPHTLLELETMPHHSPLSADFDVEAARDADTV